MRLAVFMAGMGFSSMRARRGTARVRNALCLGRLWSSGALAQQEVERRAVKGLGVLVQPGMREVVEDHQLACGDPVLEWLGKAGGAYEVARSEGD
jgi:hypothetical protein